MRKSLYTPVNWVLTILVISELCRLFVPQVVTMNSVLSVRSLTQMFGGKAQDIINEIDNVHMVWLEEIQQEANRMFSRDFNAEPELMPKTASQKKNSRRKRVSLGPQEENQGKKRYSKGRRSNLRGSSVKSLQFTAKEDPISEVSTSDTSSTGQSKRTTRRNKQTKPEVVDDESPSPHDSDKAEEVQNKTQMLQEKEVVVVENKEVNDAKVKPDDTVGNATPPESLKIPLPEAVVSISHVDRLSAELAKEPEPSPGRTAAKIAIAESAQISRRSSVQCSLKLRHSLAGLRHSMTQESVRRASRRSMLKRKATRAGNSTCSTKGIQQSLMRITRSVAANSPKLAPPSLFISEMTHNRATPDTIDESPTKRCSPPKKSQSAIKPHMKSFLHTVQKNQMLMMTPNSVGRTAVIKSFIKHNTPLRIDPKTKERNKLEALKKKQEQEEERMRKMEEDKKRKQEELKRKRDERLRRVFEAKVKEEQREEEKKKKIEQKMAQIDEKNDKRVAEEKAKKKAALKRQEELEQKRKMEEEARKKKIQQEEEKRQQELLAKKKAEEEARKALELKREQERERERELERERQAAAERERVEKEKAFALQREVERAAREKEMRELEEKRKALEEKRKLVRNGIVKQNLMLEHSQYCSAAKEKAAKELEAAKQRDAAAQEAAKTQVQQNLHTPVGKGGELNVTVDIEHSSPQSYAITPKGGDKPLILSKNPEDYGMDQNSDDSTDDESAPRKPIPSWAEGPNLQQIIMKQYFNPPDLDSFFGAIESPRLENIFYKSKPRYFKRTSSAVWHSPPAGK
uniref:Inner centromere protein A-like n=1 Tax=Neolamprologus brichardi TaxID=32507 RepID=A0A3Q4HD00_NEOBR